MVMKNSLFFFLCFTTLRTISLCGTFFFLLPSSFAQEEDDTREFTNLAAALVHPEKVERLNLRKQKLSEIPPEIFQFTNLKVLNLSKNKITRVPKEIGQLSQLAELDLSSNRIDLLPMEIGQLTNLKKLVLGKNELYSLPSSFGNFSSLEYLDLWSNNLTELPPEMGKLPRLKLLDLRLIQFNKTRQEEIQKLLPNTFIYFSSSCNCD